MEPNHIIPNESFSYSLRLSFDTESFIEFDPKLMSMRWSFRSHHRHEDKEEEEAPSPCSSQNFRNLEVSSVPKKNKSSILVFRKYLWFVLLKVCRRMKLARGIEGNPSGERVSLEKGRGSRVFHLDTESSIDEAVLHCKNSNLSSLMDYEA
ncbi:uncharacterized protein A4U43_C01F3940 [Asparagus officinalis]|uniref:Uncharacterized protein n=1 Tax=Asparagus officinalis TaxID=4686 RepID=A0A5P1FR99_ASPOF|nr:uncharacterized protein A4U43_C01F3940 [Asparagus officinalis]